jgi:tol-pal system protein YbgF
MLKIRLFLFGILCLVAAPSFAGLFSDNEAREQIVELESRLSIVEVSLSKLEGSFRQQAGTIAQQASALTQQTSAMLDLQASVEALRAELQKLRGQNEELAHNLQDAEKRQKDLYVDLDGRLRRFEAGDVGTADKASGRKGRLDDPAIENRALEAAYGFYKNERYQNAVSAFQEFLNNYPQSAQVANIRYWMGNAYFVLKDYKSSLENYQILVSKFDTYPKLADAMLSIADCQELLRDKSAAQLTLKQIAVKFPNSEAADKAKKHLAILK